MMEAGLEVMEGGVKRGVPVSGGVSGSVGAVTIRGRGGSGGVSWVGVVLVALVCSVKRGVIEGVSAFEAGMPVAFGSVRIHCP